MGDANKQVFVTFNPEQVALYNDLVTKGLTARFNFRDFVKTAFYNEVERIRADQLDMSVQNIERLAFEAVQKAAQKALQN